MTTIRPTNGEIARELHKGALATVNASLQNAEELSHELRQMHKRLGDVSWALDEGLRTLRIAAAGDQRFGVANFVPIGEIADRIARAARVVSRLKNIDIS